jgi:8-oxo-dGTP pyrophosphatase MutT (NUDIX family)
MSKLILTSPTIDDIRQALAQPLPGKAAQMEMAPEMTDGEVDRWGQVEDYREAGVLLLLYPYRTGSSVELHIALIRRAKYPGVHSGQISFPGGRREDGETLLTTALRETWEEVGVLPDTIQIIGELSSLYTAPSNFCIHPFIAYRSSRPVFSLETKEVAELIETPLSLLLNPATCKQEIWSFPDYGDRRVSFFDIFGHKVWGATAMMLSEFVVLLKGYTSCSLSSQKSL